MSGQHTPGPWVVSTHCRDLIVAGNEGGGAVAQALGPALGSPEFGANARLIAAAPDLLAALEALAPYLDAIVCYASTMDEHEPNRIAAEARAAIAKARGEVAA